MQNLSVCYIIKSEFYDERTFILKNSIYLLVTVILCGIAKNLKDAGKISNTTGLILFAIAIYFLFLFLYSIFKSDREDKREAAKYKQLTKEREMMNKRRKSKKR